MSFLQANHLLCLRRFEASILIPFNRAEKAHLGTHAGLLYLIAADVLLSLAAGALLEDYLLKLPLALWDKAVHALRHLGKEQSH